MTIAEYLRPERWLNPAAGPLYVQLRKRIEAAIASGLLPPESALPPEREIATVTELSRVTVRKAMSDLAEQGIVVQRQGSGSFVAPRKARVEQSLSQLTSFTEDMARRGLRAESHWLERGLFLPNADEVAILGLAPGDQVARLARLRMADARPMAIERASLSMAVLPNPLAVTHSLYDVLGRAGLRPVRAVQKISAINLDAADADLLDLPVQAAGLRIERVSYLADGRVAEFTRSVYRGDAYDFVAELHPIPEGAAP
jgi:GntR family transcriptional regulator